MQASTYPVADSPRYAKCVEVSKRIRWDIERDVIRGRRFDFSKPFLPDNLSKVDGLDFLSESEQRLLSQIQGRSYANIFGLVERFIGAKVLEVSRAHWLGDQTALEALVRFTDEELKHQEMFRRLDKLMEEDMPAGYSLVTEPNAIAEAVLSKSTWAVLALTCHIELFTQLHYRSSIDKAQHIDPLWKDVFLYHWREESQHAILDELEWKREDARLTPEARDRAVDDLIELVVAVDGILQAQSQADVHYFLSVCGRPFSAAQAGQIQDTVLKAYRWQYILSGVQDERFASIIGELLSEEQGKRIAEALSPLTA
jgi:hypothetical protein